MILQQTPGLLKRIYPSLTWKKESENEIFLTFDDGPHPTITRWILDELDKYQAKATFFCVGENLSLFREMAEETRSRGHMLANHTFRHENGWKTRSKNYLKSISACNDLLAEMVNCSNQLFRPPYGRIKRNQISEVRKNYEIVMWSHLSWDFKKNLDISSSIENLQKAQLGSIVVFHDNEKSFGNLKKILPPVLEHWSSLNYEFSVL